MRSVLLRALAGFRSGEDAAASKGGLGDPALGKLMIVGNVSELPDLALVRANCPSCSWDRLIYRRHRSPRPMLCISCGREHSTDDVLLG